MKQTMPCSSRGIVILLSLGAYSQVLGGEGGGGEKELWVLVKLDIFKASAGSSL